MKALGFNNKAYPLNSDILEIRAKYKLQKGEVDMKKTKILLSALALIILLSLSGCNNNEKNTANSSRRPSGLRKTMS